MSSHSDAKGLDEIMARRHIIANAFMITVFVSYFGPVLIRVFADNNYSSKEHKLNENTL